VHSQDGWGVTYTSAQMCALKGSTVDIHCSYSYPPKIKKRITTVKERTWFRKKKNAGQVALKKDSAYTGRVKYDFYENSCTLRITDLRESDSAEYKFRFTTNPPGGSFTGSPGVTLSVAELQVQVGRTSTRTELKCLSSCDVAGPRSYVWYNNAQKMEEETSSCRVSVRDDDSYSCAVQGLEDYRSPAVYAPKDLTVSVSPSGEVKASNSVTLTCHSDANPAAKYTWFKRNVHTALSEKTQFVLRFIQSSNSGEYYCTAENKLGRRTSKYILIDVKYAPKRPSVSVSPVGEIKEGSLVFLICRSDANPAAKHSWFKRNGPPPLRETTNLVFLSIQASDSGAYNCRAENKLGWRTSEYVTIDVKYAPKLPSVSVSPSAEIVEGSSVTLSCSSDANPAANYTWYKENEDSPTASGQNFTITDFRAEHSGNYSCEAQNRRGRHKSTVYLIVVKAHSFLGAWKPIAGATVCALVLALTFTSVYLWILKDRVSQQQSQPGEPSDTREQ
ncbi:B-cell receptor CD22-like, partial [Stegastes partitus]|uniref:B-cell receptor CD22 n=1 Tax=Stegastes partitus TaxID=144197 RepID=A0A9Y4U4K2_9TELE